MNHLFFDTETTGKADLRGLLESSSQPHIVQLAALLTGEFGSEIMHFNLIVKPDGWEIPAEAAAIHGITTEYATEVGVPILDVLYLFSAMKRSANLFVAHNIDFDRFMIASEVSRSKKLTWRDDSMPRENCFCTMKAMTDMCKLPGPYGFKWPKLQEAHKHAFGVEFDGAHDALADVRACSKVYFWLNAQGAPKPVEAPLTPA